MSRNPTIEVRFTGDSRDLSRTTGKVEAELTGVGRSVSGFAVGAGAALTSFGIAAIPQLVNFGQELFTLGQSSEIALAKASKVFGSSNAAVSTWADSVNESLGLSEESVIGLAASMGDLLVPLGFTREAAADMSMETTELAGALSAWSQGKYDSAQVSEILTKAMLGEREGLKALGISISQAAVDERALALARADGRDTITDQDKALATQALILEKSTDAQTAWSDGTMDAVKSQNELKATVSDAKEALASGLVPVVQSVVSWITGSLIPAVRNVVATFKQYWPQIRETIAPVMAQIQEIVSTVLDAVSTIWNTYGEQILAYVQIVFSYIASTISNALTVIQGILDVVLGLISGDWSRVWEGIRQILSGVWEQIKNLVRSALSVVGLLLSTAWNAAKNATSSAWTSLKSSVGDAITGVVNYVRGLPRRILGVLGSLGSVLFSAGKALIGGLLRGMKDAALGMFGWVGGLAGRIAALKGPPSYDKVVLSTNGRLLIDGLLDGMRAQFPRVEAFASSIAPNLSAAMSLDSLGPRSTTRSSSTTIIQNMPQGVTPTNVTQAARSYGRTQGPL